MVWWLKSDEVAVSSTNMAPRCVSYIFYYFICIFLAVLFREWVTSKLLHETVTKKQIPHHKNDSYVLCSLQDYSWKECKTKVNCKLVNCVRYQQTLSMQCEYRKCELKNMKIYVSNPVSSYASKVTSDTIIVNASFHT